ncbi:MAG: spore germination protein [Thermaerobacter sp.]|nr:spore germination protein [Thermaerobacter sp.]
MHWFHRTLGGREGTATDIGFIDRQGRRILGLISRYEGRLDPDALKESFPDLIVTGVTRPGGAQVHIVQIPALVDAKRLHSEVLTPLSSSKSPVQTLLAEMKEIYTRQDADRELIQGAVLIFAEARVYAMLLRIMPNRAVDEPTTERAVFGPKDSFIETLDQNLALIRSHLRDPRLQAEVFPIGTQAPVKVAVLSLEGAVDPKELDDVITRLQKFRPPRVGFVSTLLRPVFGAVWSPFLPADFTERPYRAADFLSRGRIAVLVDGSPWAMLLPVQFIELFIDEEEYLQATTTRYFVRGLRLLAFAISLLGPGLYVAILTVNTTVMPGLLAIAVSSNRQSLAFPILTETVLMLIVLDVMAEATTAMKGVLGPAISIVGSLIVGQAAVRANLASNLGVILLALTALATYITPRYQLTYAVRVFKYVFLLVSGVLGLVGWSAGIIWLAISLSMQRELGVSYLAPLAPTLLGAWSTASPVQNSSQSAVPGYVRRLAPRRR